MRLFVNKAWAYGEPEPGPPLPRPQLPPHRAAGRGGARPARQARRTASRTASPSPSGSTRRSPASPASPRRAARRATTHSYWRYAVHVDRGVVPGGPVALAAALRRAGIPSAPRYIQKPAFRCGVFADQRTFGASRWPFTLARPEAVDYAAERFPGTFAFLDSVLVLPWNERYQPEHAEFVADGLRTAVEKARTRGCGVTATLRARRPCRSRSGPAASARPTPRPPPALRPVASPGSPTSTPPPRRPWAQPTTCPSAPAGRAGRPRRFDLVGGRLPAVTHPDVVARRCCAPASP